MSKTAVWKKGLIGGGGVIYECAFSPSCFQAGDPLHCHSPADLFHSRTEEPFPVRHGNGPGSSDGSHDLFQVNAGGVSGRSLCQLLLAAAESRG